MAIDPIYSSIFWKLLGWLRLDEEMRILGRWIRALLGRTKRTPYMPALSYGQLQIDDWHVLNGIHYQGLSVRPVLDDGSQFALPPELQQHRDHFAAEVEMRVARGEEEKFYDGPFFPMVSFHSRRMTDGSERPSFMIRVVRTGFYNYASTIASLDDDLFGGNGTVRSNYFKDWHGQVDPRVPVIGCPGLTLAVITKDMFVIMAKRSAIVSVAPGAWHCSVDQGVKLPDIEEGVVDYRKVALRGLHHELGILPEELHGTPTITSMGYSTGFCQYGVIGHVRVNRYYEDVVKDLPKSPTGKENKEWKGVPFEPKALAKEFKRMIKDGEPPMVSFGAATLIMALGAKDFDHTEKDIAKAFDDKVFADGRLLYPSKFNPPNVHAFA